MMSPAQAVSGKTLAVVLEKPETLALSLISLDPPTDEDVVVDMEFSAISTGTERLLWSGSMPAFPGLGYPLVPGYESVGRIVHAGKHTTRHVGERVFVPGARCFGEVRGLFGGAASRVVVPGSRVTPLDQHGGEKGVLLALAATAHHALRAPHSELPDLIVGHGVVGRLLARLSIVLGGTPPVVWERNANRAQGALGYEVIHPDLDQRRDYRAIYDVGGDGTLLDALIKRLAPNGEIVLAGFYGESLSFAFPAAFMREVRLRIAAEWREADLLSVQRLIDTGQLNLDGLITHRRPASAAPDAYRTAFTDPSCLKMVLDWRVTE